MNHAEKNLEALKKKANDLKGSKITRSFATKQIPVDEEEKTATFVMSTSSIDRQNEKVDQDSWILEHFRKAPRFFLQHKSDEMPIGKWKRIWFEEDPNNEGEKRMMGKAEFATEIYDQAELAFDMVKGGYLNSVSVGFIPNEVEFDEEKDIFKLSECELFECSLVGVPSNRDSLLRDQGDIAEQGKSAREDAIKAKKKLQSQIEKKKDDEVIEALKARENLNKAIRNMK